MDGLKQDAERKAAEMCRSECCKKVRIQLLRLDPTGGFMGLRRPRGYDVVEIGGNHPSYDYQCPQK
jgi:hypothetical protein